MPVLTTPATVNEYVYLPSWICTVCPADWVVPNASFEKLSSIKHTFRYSVQSRAHKSRPLVTCKEMIFAAWSLTPHNIASLSCSLARKAVSYTHLDVYKRQDMNSGLWMARWTPLITIFSPQINSLMRHWIIKTCYSVIGNWRNWNHQNLNKKSAWLTWFEPGTFYSFDSLLSSLSSSGSGYWEV